MTINEELKALRLSVFVLILFIFFMLFNMKSDAFIESQKVFKLGDATYQCKIIQKLEYGDE